MWRERLPDLQSVVFAAVDTETTGLIATIDELVEVAIVKFDHHGNVLGEFAELIKPEKPIPKVASSIHGIGDALVAEAAPAREVVARAMEFVAGDNVVLVAHNAPFDLAFLAPVLAKAGLRLPEGPVLDTRLLAIHLLPKLQKRSLDDVRLHLGIEIGERHRALADAHAVRLALIEMLMRLGPGQFENLPRQVEVITFADAAVVPVAPPEGYEELGVAIAEGLEVEIIYHGGSTPGRSRQLKPVLIYRQGGKVYLAAYDPRRGFERTYRVDRIEGVRVVRKEGR